MEATRKLYDDAPYGKSFTAKVIAAEKKADNWEVVLDQTLFFPEEGGQCADTGCLFMMMGTDADAEAGNCAGIADDCAGKEDSWRVTDVQIQNGIIYHQLETPADVLQPGMIVRGEIDWDGRFSNMQNHTGEHIISGLIHTRFGFDNVGFHLSKNIVTLDQSGYLSPDEVTEIEREANKVVWANLPVTAEYFSPEDAKEKSYRSKIEIEGPVRLVTIGQEQQEDEDRVPGVVDACACCAPHVAYTGEVGLIKILRSEKYKGGTRMTILCGGRALEEVAKRQTQIEEISHLLRAKQDKTFAAVQHLFDENTAQKERLIRMQEEKIRYLAGAAFLPGGRNGETDQKIEAGDNIWIFTADLDPLPHRNLVNMLMEKCDGYAGVFLLQDEQNYRFIIGSNTKDCREAAKLMKEALAAKGGGKPEMVQGSLVADSREKIKTALEQL